MTFTLWFSALMLLLACRNLSLLLLSQSFLCWGWLRLAEVWSSHNAAGLRPAHAPVAGPVKRGFQFKHSRRGSFRALWKSWSESPGLLHITLKTNHTALATRMLGQHVTRRINNRMNDWMNGFNYQIWHRWDEKRKTCSCAVVCRKSGILVCGYGF